MQFRTDLEIQQARLIEAGQLCELDEKICTDSNLHSNDLLTFHRYY